MPVLEKLDPAECKFSFRNLNGLDSAEINQYSNKGAFTFFDRLTFEVQIEKRQTPFTVINLNTVNTGVFTYQPKNYDWITSTETLKSVCRVDNQYLIDKDGWSKKFKEISLDYDDEPDKLIFGGHTLPCLH